MTAVSLHELSKRYADVSAVDCLSLSVASGELVALLGPSGCGKTTTMRMIAGLLAPTAGDIRFDGQSVLNIAPERRGAVMVFQKHLLFPHMNVADNVGFGLKMRGVDKTTVRNRVEMMLELVQLPGYGLRRPDELSGGQQQRVALARALIIEPAVLLLDEPLANLDANLRLEMRQLIRTIQQEMGITTLFVTHDQEEAVMLADRVALMMDGRLLQYDEPRAFYDRPLTEQVARFFRNENLLPGVKRGARVETAAGVFTVCPSLPVGDGPVLLTVRPEHVVLNESVRANCVDAVVESAVFMGTHTQVLLRFGGVRWIASAPPTLQPQNGESIFVTLPEAHLWLIPT
jgi:ABC-type Fe3+/spermidine/putrescine transport system ATPase subunit